MKLGERIYKLRSEKNLSQGDLADALEVSRQSISKWETNASVPELDKLIKLSEVFDVSLDYLITGKEKAEQHEPAMQEEKPFVPPAEPQVIYIEKPAKSTITVAQIFGIVLLACAALCLILFACFGKRSYFEDVLILCLPVALWGFVCLVTKYPLLWSCWSGSAAWWVYLLVRSTRWERAILLVFIGVVLVIASLGYTVYLHKKERIHISAWGMGLLALILVAAAVLLLLNFIPFGGSGTPVRPSEVITNIDLIT